MSKPRKLLTPSAMTEIIEKRMQGVPLARIMRQLNIDTKITRPVVAKLLAIYPHNKESLFPEWMDNTGPAIQSQPENYKYNGFFPLGVWVKCRTSNHSST